MFLELSVEQLDWLKQIWGARVRLGENILNRTQDCDLPKDFNLGLEIDKSILSQIEKIEK